ncbi:MAG: Gfo/Idh/MocA family protein [Bryobacteraceae bacterium]
MNDEILSRRDFGRNAAAAMTAASYGRILGANDRIRVGNIGCGRRGLLKEVLLVKDMVNVEVPAVCDIWKQRREKAAADVKEFTGKDAQQVVHYGDILTNKDIDAVIIGTPDHQHCTMLIEAIRAGKDVYVEKPLAMNMKELIRAYDTVKKSDRVVQIGTQMRSYPQAAPTREFLTSGKLGKILKVEQVRNGYKPYWVRYGEPGFPEKPSEGDIDWKAFVMNRKPRAFDPVQVLGWYGFRDFSSGPHTNLMVHYIDLVHFVLNLKFPKRVVAIGGTYRWKEQYDVPDSVEVTYEYPEGFLVRYCTVFGNGAGNYARWSGTLGTLDARNLSSREEWIATGDGSQEPDKLTQEVRMAAADNGPAPHMRNFFECVRSRQETIAPIDAGYAHSVAVIMADEAMSSGRRLTYDPSRREIHPG